MAISSVVSLLLVLGIWGSWFALAGPLDQQSYASPFGWVAVLAGALVFSFTEVPVKVPGSQQVGPILFNAYGFVGSTLVNGLAFPALWALGLPFEFQIHGCLAALDLMVVQYFARQAVWLLGIGAAPACWSAVGMLTSFLWGTVVFGDTPWNLPMAAGGLVLLLSGVVFVSLAVYLSHRSEERFVTTPDPSAPTRGKVVLGLGLAVLTGLCDGSLVAFFVRFERQSDAGRTLHGMLQYFGSFALAIGALDLIVVLGYMTVGPGRKLSRADLQLWQCGVPGALSGVAWSLANSCGILGAHYMGMALAFPLTQTATILSGMWGLFIFRELKTRLAAGVFLFAMVMAAAGALLLALFGRASAPWG